MTKYNREDIEKFQEATNILINFLDNNKSNTVEDLKNKSLESFQEIILNISKLFKENYSSMFQDSPEFEIHKNIL